MTFENMYRSSVLCKGDILFATNKRDVMG